MTTENWQKLGGLMGGTVMALALSPNFVNDGLSWAATRTGLLQSSDGGKSWSRNDAPGFQTMTSVAASPGYDQDHTLFIGTQNGLFASTDGGKTWGMGKFPHGPTPIAAVAVSPAFLQDGIAFAGSVVDGIFRSHDRGAVWHAWNFGLLDLNLLAIAVSPSFARDETLFVAATTGLFRSKNGGRAWREVGFPNEAAPILSLAISPAFATDNTLFAGTETAGLFRSTDRGATWQILGELPAEESINSLAISPHFTEDRTIMAITGGGLYVSQDAGGSWTRQVELTGALCLATSPSATLIGLAQQGICRSGNEFAHWELANVGLTARAASGLVVSPAFGDNTLFAYGPEEGLFRSTDGGQTWAEAMDGFASVDVNAVVISPVFAHDGTLFAGLADGIWRSTDRGDHWDMVSDAPTQSLAISPDFRRDGILLAGQGERGALMSLDRGRSWRPLDIPADAKNVVALHFSPTFSVDAAIFLASIRTVDKILDVWLGDRFGKWQRAVGYDCQGTWASITASATFAQDGIWFAASGNAVYRPAQFVPKGRGLRDIELAAHPVASDSPAVLGVVSVLDQQRRMRLFAASVEGVFVSQDGGRTWSLTGESSPKPVLAVVPSPNYATDRQLYGLAMGGTIWRALMNPDMARAAMG